MPERVLVSLISVLCLGYRFSSGGRLSCRANLVLLLVEGLGSPIEFWEGFISYNLGTTGYDLT